MDDFSRFTTYLVAGWAGFYVMAIEILGARILAPYFGGSIYVWGAVITVFMLGLSIGYLIGGHLSTREATLLKLGTLLLFSVLATVPLLFSSSIILDLIFHSLNEPKVSVLLASFILFLLPAITLGTISPYCVRIVTDNVSRSGQVAGKLYFVSTLGSASGTLVTSFYLVILFGLDQILFGLSAITATLSTLVIFYGRISTTQKIHSTHAAQESKIF